MHLSFLSSSHHSRFPQQEPTKFLLQGTSTISIHTARVDGQDIYLIDTPGFDDTTRSDTEILEDVAAWLKRSYDARITLAGIIYLHRIQDNRVGGPGAANIRMFKELCGADRLSCVVLATTRWDSLSDERARSQAIAREDELKSTPGFWGELVRCGARVCRQDEGVRSAEKIVADLVQLRMRTTLRIQEEVADGVPVNETGAGRVVEDEMKKMKAEMATMKKWIEDLLEKQAQQKKAAEEERAKWDAEREDQRRRKEEKRRKKEEEELPKRKKETEEYEEKRKAWEREKQQWEENRKARRTIEELEEKIKALEQGFRESGNRQKPKDADEKADSTNQPTNPPKSRTCILM